MQRSHYNSHWLGKILRCFIDQSLIGEFTVEFIVQNVNSGLCFLYRQTRSLDVRIKMFCFSALMQRHIDNDAVHGLLGCQNV